MSIESRRKLLKSIVAGSGAIVAGKSLPESWSRPVVDSVILPAHAETSQTAQTALSYTSTITAVQGENWLGPLVRTAHAGPVIQPSTPLVEASVCVVFETNMLNFTAQLTITEENWDGDDQIQQPSPITATANPLGDGFAVDDSVLFVSCTGQSYWLKVESGPNASGVPYTLCYKNTDGECVSSVLMPGECPAEIDCPELP